MNSKSTRPKIHIPLTDWDKVLIGITVLACIFMLVYPLYFYDALPDQIPTKFDRSGKPTSYSRKSTLMVMSAVGILTSLPLLYLAKFPHTFNYGFTKINEDNARPYYRLGVTLIRLIAAYTALLFAFISYDIISAAMNLGTSPRDSIYEFYILGGLVAMLGWYIYSANQIEKSNA